MKYWLNEINNRLGETTYSDKEMTNELTIWKEDLRDGTYSHLLFTVYTRAGSLKIEQEAKNFFVISGNENLLNKLTRREK